MPVFDTALIGSIWLAEDIGGTGVVDNLQSKLQFVSPTQVAGHAGCNSFSGTAVLTTAKLSIGPLASTRKMCPPAVMDQENRFLRTLETVHSARVENDLLYLTAVSAARLALLIIAIATTGCGRKQPDSAEPQSAPAPAPTTNTDAEPPAGALRAYYWQCEGGLEFVMKNLWRENAVTLGLHEGSRRLGAGTLEHKPAAPVKCTETRARSLVEDARARGVVLRGRGNEPGWTVEVGPAAALVLETNYGAERHAFAHATASGEGSIERTYSAEQDGQRIEVTVRQESCQDDMSGEAFDHSFRVTFGDATLEGCGARLNPG
jgi:heat shock protein HslJ/uncharacterized membrane protein